MCEVTFGAAARYNWRIQPCFFSELKDSMAGDTIEGEVPELLKAILAQDPSVFKGGSGNRYVDHTGMLGSQLNESNLSTIISASMSVS